jgi:hypothetical protein
MFMNLSWIPNMKCGSMLGFFYMCYIVVYIPSLMSYRVLLVQLEKKDQKDHKENEVHEGLKGSLDHLTSFCYLWQMYGTVSGTYRRRFSVVMGEMNS